MSLSPFIAFQVTTHFLSFLPSNAGAGLEHYQGCRCGIMRLRACVSQDCSMRRKPLHMLPISRRTLGSLQWMLWDALHWWRRWHTFVSSKLVAAAAARGCTSAFLLTFQAGSFATYRFTAYQGTMLCLPTKPTPNDGPTTGRQRHHAIAK